MLLILKEVNDSSSECRMAISASIFMCKLQLNLALYSPSNKPPCLSLMPFSFMGLNHDSVSADDFKYLSRPILTMYLSRLIKIHRFNDLIVTLLTCVFLY